MGLDSTKLPEQPLVGQLRRLQSAVSAPLSFGFYNFFIGDVPIPRYSTLCIFIMVLSDESEEPAQVLPRVEVDAPRTLPGKSSHNSFWKTPNTKFVPWGTTAAVLLGQFNWIPTLRQQWAQSGALPAPALLLLTQRKQRSWSVSDGVIDGGPSQL